MEYFSNWYQIQYRYREHFQWNCPHVNDTRQQKWFPLWRSDCLMILNIFMENDLDLKTGPRLSAVPACMPTWCAAGVFLSWHLIFIMGIPIVILILKERPGACVNIKILPYQYRDPHVEDKTVSQPNFLSLGNPHIWERWSWYWNSAQYPYLIPCEWQQRPFSREPDLWSQPASVPYFPTGSARSNYMTTWSSNSINLWKMQVIQIFQPFMCYILQRKHKHVFTF